MMTTGGTVGLAEGIIELLKMLDYLIISGTLEQWWRKTFVAGSLENEKCTITMHPCHIQSDAILILVIKMHINNHTDT